MKPTSLIKFSYACKLHSLNAMYKRGRAGNTYLDEDAKALKEALEWQFIKYRNYYKQDDLLCFTLDLRANWFTKRETIRKRDASNIIKLLEDAVANILQVDDCQFFAETIRKITVDKSKMEGFTIQIAPLKIFNELTDNLPSNLGSIPKRYHKQLS